MKNATSEVYLEQSSHPILKTVGKNASPEFYIFNRVGNGGFVIVSGDDATPAILGFSTEGNITPDSIPENLADHLNSFREQIAYARANSLPSVRYKAGPTSKQGKRLLTPNWNQTGFPYNGLIPGNVHAGCVPAAMSIIMGAWHWPNTGTGSSQHSGYVYGLGPTVRYNIDLDHNVEFNLSDIPFDIKETTPTPEQEYSLANLLYHTSVSVRSAYDVNGSSASLSNAQRALIDHFKFAPTAEFVWAYTNDYEKVASDLKSEIDAGRIVFYSASNKDSGHAFVCDGVWDEYFHFNLGWGGNYNGWYLLTAIAPKDGAPGYYDRPDYITGLAPDQTDPDYTPRSIPVVYDELPTEDEKPVYETSSTYSPVEFIAGAGFGLVSPRTSYPQKTYISLYYSGLALTGNFSGTSEEYDDKDISYGESVLLAVGVINSQGNLLKIYPQSYPTNIYKNPTTSISTLSFTPDINISATDKICLFASVEGGDFKQIMGLPGISSVITPSTPTSSYLPFMIDYDKSTFRLAGVSGQLGNKVVLGQDYWVALYPQKGVKSIDVKNHGVPVSFIERPEYFIFNIKVTDENGVNLTVRELTAEQSNITVNLSQPGTLAAELNGKESQVRELTVVGNINVTDIKYIENKELFCNLKKIDLAKANICEYNPLYLANTLYYHQFYNNNSLREVTLPATLKEIPDYVFAFCYNLNKLTLAPDVTNYPDYCFARCPFTEVYSPNPVPPTIGSRFVSDIDSNATLYVPKGSKDAYLKATNWSAFPVIMEYDFSEPDGITDLTIDDLKIVRRNGRLEVTGTDLNVKVSVYSLSGILLWTGRADKIGEVTLPDELLIVATPSKVYKIR